jgi:DNA repair protein RadA/Sms
MIYVCHACRRRHREPKARCECGAWEQIRAEGREEKQGPVPLSEIATERARRISLGDPRLDKFFGGGLVHGTVSLLYGAPGWGKSTLLLQIAKNSGHQVLYAVSEESEQEIALRAKRLGFTDADKERVLIHYSTVIDEALDDDLEIDLLIVDSAHGYLSEGETGLAGETHQVRAVASKVVQFAQRTGVPVLLAGQVNKKNDFSGPRAAAHGVTSETRLRMVHGSRTMLLKKNRHGPTPMRLGVTMGPRGMELAEPGAK